jgi:hypothetical protein
MTALWSLLLLAVSAVGALAIARAAARSSDGGVDPLASVLAAWTWCFAFVTASFHALGYLEIATGRPLLRMPWALAAGLVLVAGVWVAAGGSKRGAVAAAGDWVAVAGRIARAKPRWLVRITVAVYVATVMLVFAIGFPAGAEAVAYHLPNGFVAFQTGSLRIADSMFYSANNADAGLWGAYLATFASERFVALAQLPFLPALALAAYGCARCIGADARAAAFAAIGILSVPVIWQHAGVAEADSAGLAFVAIALYFVLASDLPRMRFVVAGLALGLAFGIKSLFLVAGVLVFLVAIAQGWGRRRLVGDVAIVVGCAIALGGFWLVRNHVQTGNPLYPFAVGGISDLLGWRAAPDIDPADGHAAQFMWVRSLAEWPLYPWLEWHAADAGTHYKSNAGLGALIATALPLSALVVAFVGLRRAASGDDTTARVRLAVLAAGVAMLVAWWLLGQHQPRYASAAFVFLLPIVAVAIAMLQGTARRGLERLLGLASVWMLVAFLTQDLATFGDRVVYSRQTTRAQYYEYPSSVDRLSAGSVILNLDSRVANYPLIGAHYANRVVRFEIALRTFGIDADQRGWNTSLKEHTKGVRLTAPLLRQLGVTHVYMRPQPLIATDCCITLHELGRIDRNPVSRAAIDPPKVLYRVGYCDAAPG